MRDYSKTDYSKQKEKMTSLLKATQEMKKQDKSNLDFIVYDKEFNEFLRCKSRPMAISTAKRIDGTYSKIE